MQDKRAFLISISFSFLAMYLVYQYISKEEKKLTDDYKKTVLVVRAKKDILQYSSIRPTDIETISVPIAIAPLGAIDIKEDAFDAVAAVPISAGEFILDNKLISKNIYSGLESQVTREKRAISVPVNVKSAVGYLLRPGNRVDLAAHFEYVLPKSGGGPANKPASEAKVFLQDLLVLASGRTIQATPPKAVDKDMIRSLKQLKDDNLNKQSEAELREALNYAKEDRNYQTVTLEVTPQQAQTLVYVLSLYGESLTLLLRHSDDRQKENRSPTNLAKVMGPDSYMNRAPKLPPVAVPKYKFFDYVGEGSNPVPTGGP
ncbi:MAG: Flp pilus assembly protein CpaB [Proteobacteria bacterium]|nr:Flp pilus assembly protein CpaB [Pseudomonadota bacterium]NBY20485.1 Flp pilus assembly protein CpaB [bacterium]